MQGTLWYTTVEGNDDGLMLLSDGGTAVTGSKDPTGRQYVNYAIDWVGSTGITNGMYPFPATVKNPTGNDPSITNQQLLEYLWGLGEGYDLITLGNWAVSGCAHRV